MASSIETEFEDIDMDSVPASALNVSSRMTLSWLLNPDQPIRCSTGAARDYRGLAELMDFEYNDIRNFQRSEDPTAKILETWEKQSNSTIGLLIKFLEKMERFDVIEDSMHLFKNDAVAYMKRCKRNKENAIQVPEVTSCRPAEGALVEDHSALTADYAQPGAISCQSMDNPDILTLDDYKTKTPHFYDAYVCYADEDVLFVKELAKYLEAQGLKLFIKDRDTLVGHNKYDAYVRLIDERCNCMLIMLSPEFLTCDESKFQATYAAGLAIEQRKRKLIPVIIKQCNIPLILRYISKIDFTRPSVQNWLWDKLVQSIKGVNSSIFVSCSPGILPSSAVGSQSLTSPSQPLPLTSPSQSFPLTSPDPVVDFPPTVQQSLEPTISATPELPSSPQVSIETAKSTSSRKVSGSQANTTKQATKRGWFSNIREKMSLNSSTAHSSSTATSGYQSQSTYEESSVDIE